MSTVGMTKNKCNHLDDIGTSDANFCLYKIELVLVNVEYYIFYKDALIFFCNAAKIYHL